MATQTYWEKLKDPRWQKKRLKIMERDNFACTNCGDDSATLNVHHSFYKRGRAPWDYHDQWLVTLCEDCHKAAGENVERMFTALVYVSDTIYPEFITGFCLGRAILEAAHDGPPCAEVKLESDEEIRGALAAWGQGRLPDDFSMAPTGETMLEYLVRVSGVVRLSDPGIRDYLKRTPQCY